MHPHPRCPCRHGHCHSRCHCHVQLLLLLLHLLSPSIVVFFSACISASYFYCFCCTATAIAISVCCTAALQADCPDLRVLRVLPGLRCYQPCIAWPWPASLITRVLETPQDSNAHAVTLPDRCASLTDGRYHECLCTR